jgi:hypothetical protein
MLYRALFGIVPMLLIALFASGAIPISSLMPAAGQVSGKAGVDSVREAAASRIEEVVGVRPDQAILMEEELRKAEEEMERKAAERRQRVDRPGWAPSGGGWAPGAR